MGDADDLETDPDAIAWSKFNGGFFYKYETEKYMYVYVPLPQYSTVSFGPIVENYIVMSVHGITPGPGVSLAWEELRDARREDAMSSITGAMCKCKVYATRTLNPTSSGCVVRNIKDPHPQYEGLCWTIVRVQFLEAEQCFTAAANGKTACEDVDVPQL